MKFILVCQFLILFSKIYSQNSISLHNVDGETKIILQNSIDSITFSNFNSTGWLEFNPYLNYGSIIDQNGNLYKTILIGSQEWMAENLRSITFTNGDSIPNLKLNQQWSTTNSSAWSHYNNDSSFNIRHGKLYNGYTAVDNRNVCPSGWHVPTIIDWSKLMAAVGEFETFYTWKKLTTMGKMSIPGGWYENTNETGFSAFPCSHRLSNGAFPSPTIIDGPWYWTSNFYYLNPLNPNPNLIYNRFVGRYNSPYDNPESMPKSGLPIRCVKN